MVLKIEKMSIFYQCAHSFSFIIIFELIHKISIISILLFATNSYSTHLLLFGMELYEWFKENKKISVLVLVYEQIFDTIVY